MTKVTYKPLPNEETEFINIDKDTLLPAIYEYARTSNNDDIYNAILVEKISIIINGKVIHPDEWYNYQVKETDEVIIVSNLGWEAAVAAGAWVATVIGAVGAVATVVTYAVAVMIMIAASLALSFLSQLIFSPDLPSLGSLSGYGGGKETQTYNWSGIKTVAKTNTPLPIVYGTHKVGGNVISMFTSSYGSDNYINMLIALCEGEIDGICRENDYTKVCSTSDTTSEDYYNPAIELNDQLISLYNNFEWWYRKGTNDIDATKDQWNPTVQNKIPWFDSARMQYDDGRNIIPSGVVYTTTKDIDMVTLQVSVPALYSSDNTGLQTMSVSYKVEYKLEEESVASYQTFPIQVWIPEVTGLERDDGVTTNAINCTCDKFRQYGGKKNGDIIDPTYTLKITENNQEEIYNSRSIPAPPYIDPFGTSIANTTFNQTLTYNIKFDVIDSRDNIVSSRVLENNIIVNWNYIETHTEKIEGKFTTIPGHWEQSSVEHQYTTFYIDDYKIQFNHLVEIGDIFQIEPSLDSVQDQVTITDLTKTGVWNSITMDFNNIDGASGKDTYSIRISRTDGGSSSSLKVSNEMILHSVTEIVDGYFIYPNTALLGLRIKATDQLSGQPPNVTTIVRGLKIPVPDLEDATPVGNATTFDNCFWDEDNNRWINNINATVYWNDTTSWRDTNSTKEYSNNSISCVRDLMTSSRYGLGDYVTTSDLKSSEIITSLKECHKSYNSYTTEDFLSWWDNGDSDKWSISDSTPSTLSINLNTSNSRIEFSDTTSNWGRARIILDLDSNIQYGHYYDLSITVSDIAEPHPLNQVLVYVKNTWAFPSYTGITLIKSINNVTAGTYTQAFRAAISSDKVVILATGISGLNFNLTDVSLTQDTLSDHYHTWDGVLESDQSALVALLEMCDSFRCWPIWYGGKFNFIIDKDDTPIHTLTDSNITKFSQSFTPLSEIPYKLIGQFVDSSMGYLLRSIIARSTSTTLIKLNEKQIGLKGITNRQKAERELVHKLNRVTNCTHVVEFECGMDMLHGTAGDIINIQHSLPSWGAGGRVLDHTVASNCITLNATYAFDDLNATYIIRYQTDENDFVTATINNATSNGIQDITTVSWPASPCTDSVYAIGNKDTVTKSFRLVSVKRSSDEKVEGIGIEHISSLYTDEPTITVIDDINTTLPNPLAIPGTPRNISVSQLEAYEGIGFNLGANPPLDNTNVTEIVVSISDANNGIFNIVANIPVNNKTFKLIDNNLITDHTYYFRFVAKTEHGRLSQPIETTCTLQSIVFKPLAPTGISIANNLPNDSTFDTKDVTIIWNPVGINPNSSITIKGYKVEIYHDSILNTNLLRTESLVTSNEYTYTLTNNLDDSNSTTPHNTLIFKIYTINSNMTESEGSRPFLISNSTPSAPSGLSAVTMLGGTIFTWTKCTDQDWKSYSYRIKVESDSWSSWVDTTDNSITRSLTSTEIDTYGSRATIYIEVKTKDWYDQESSASSTDTSSNIISDNIFKIVASSSGGSGYAASTLDGNKTSGGVTIT